ncbi:MAG: 4-alpha-glucanotransferase [Acidobacteria bacterium]|nr:4-alpha-glucanotransferase [Acidobacteriota bacterium]
MNFSRASGILLHPTSLPGGCGLGDLGPEAYKFVNFLVSAGQSLWQVLPLGPTGYGDSPYACYSAFAGNTLLVSTGVGDSRHDTNPDRVEFGDAHRIKEELLRREYENYTKTTDTNLRSAFETFAQREAHWLDDYALFRALKDAHNGVAWYEWEPSLVRRTPAALARAREQLREEIEAQMFYQFLFFEQWFKLKNYCNEHGIKVVGDLPIFVAHDSADVWTNPDQFKLDKDGRPLVVAGVPPDYFSSTGQLWGNPLYNWERMEADGFKWWIERVRATLKVVDIARVDHFRGFAACWEIPGGDKTAERGQWVEAPGRELFTAIRKTLGQLPIIAEDLGVITPDVVALRDDFGFPGMRILQFGFGGDSKNTDLPHNYVQNVVAYTGTHDNDTTVGWFESVAGEGSTRTAEQIARERKFCLDYLNSEGKEIHWDFIRTVLASVANTAIVPLQDLLGLGTEARMNLPNSTEGNWSWRYRAELLTDQIAARLKAMTTLYGRLLVFLIFLNFCSLLAVAQNAEVVKVEPQSWWTNSTVNPVRLLIRGRNLKGASIRVAGPDARIVGAPKVNERGTYAFVNLAIAPNARPGARTITVGAARASFEILPPLNRQGRFQGFSPHDVLYLIMLDRFNDGDKSNNDPPESRGIYDPKNKFYYHGGDLQGVIDRLPYLKDLGITAIWLTPWYDNYDRLNEIELKEGKPSTGFHGYNPQDFYGVEEHFGTLAKLKELVDAAHRSGIKIIQDQVVNHTGPYHPWVDDPPTPTWFNGTKANHLKNVFQTWVLHDPRPVEQLKRETMEGWFLDFLPDLNQHDTEVSRYLIQNTLWWIGVTGLDGIRMDTWQYVPNAFWRDWNAALKREFPNFRVVGEVKDGDAVHTSFFQGGRLRFDGIDSGLDSLLDFPLFYAIRHALAEGKSINQIPHILARDYLYTNSEILVTMLGGHDDGRFMSEKGATIAGLKLANAFVLTTRGVPQLYYGDEIAMTGPDEPTTRGDFPGGPRTNEERELFEYVRRLIALRRELEPLRTGKLRNLYVSEQQYVYARGDVIVAFNNDDKQAEISWDTDLNEGMRMRDRLGVSKEIVVNNKKLNVTLPKRSVSVFVEN